MADGDRGMLPGDSDFENQEAYEALRQAWNALDPSVKKKLSDLSDLEGILPSRSPSHSELTKSLVDGVMDGLGVGTPSVRTPTYTPPADQALANVVKHPAVVVVLGHRGSGKTALAVRLQELMHHAAAPYAVGLPDKARRLLPDWYGLAEDFSAIPRDAVIYMPESYRYFHARDTQSSQGHIVSDLVNLSRHRKHTLIFDVQNAAQLDRNILSEADVVLIKEPGPFQQGFERAQYRELMDRARAAFEGVSQWRRKKAVWVSAPNSGIEGKLMENLVPSFWKDSLSRLFADTKVRIDRLESNEDTGRRPSMVKHRGHKTPLEEKRLRAREMRQGGYTYGEIATVLGISRSYAYKLVNEDG